MKKVITVIMFPLNLKLVCSIKRHQSNTKGFVHIMGFEYQIFLKVMDAIFKFFFSGNKANVTLRKMWY